MMKKEYSKFEKTCEKHSLHMKRDDSLLKNEKYFDFLKMDKKNVQKMNGEKVLTDRKSSLPY